MPQVRLELSTAICSDSGWDTEVGNPTGDKSLGYRVHRDVWQQNGLGPASETIHTCE